MNDLVRTLIELFTMPLGPYLMSIKWFFPMLETLHFIALCFLFGSLLLVDLRLIGFVRGIQPARTFVFLWITLVSFAMLLITGVLFLICNPSAYWPNTAFQIKLLLIFLAGLNAAFFTIAEHRKLSVAGPDYETDTLTKSAAWASLILWTAVLFLGRSLPLFDTGQG